MTETDKQPLDDEEYASQLFFQIRLETLAALPAFDELFTFATETCLNDIQAVEDYAEALKQSREGSAEHENIHHLGNWGLRAALELQGSASTFFDRDKPDKPDATERMSIHTILKHPRSLHLERDSKIVDKIEAFGRALLDETFNVLGPDAPDKVTEYRNAATEDEKRAVVRWLLGRIIEIRDHVPTKSTADDIEVGDIGAGLIRTPIASDPSLETTHETVRIIDDYIDDDVVLQEHIEEDGGAPEDVNYYHPVRLSPKLLGAYPDTELVPTCLGLSLLAASFLEKAGAPYFHGGVMQSAQEAGRISQKLGLHMIKKTADKWELPLPDIMDQKLTDLKTEIQTVIDNNRGHHAAVVAQNAIDRWDVIDPNYHIWSTFFEEDNKRLNELFDVHTSLQKLSPGVEQSIRFGEGSLTSTFLLVMRIIAEADTPEDILDDFINAASESTEPLEEFKKYLLYFLTRKDGFEFDEDVSSVESPLDLLFEDYLGKRAGYTWRDKLAYIDQFMERVLLTYVFADAKDSDISSCLERCKTDQAYRQRRIEDLKFAPLYLVYAMQKHFVDEVGNMNVGHSIMEIGLPHYRIGISVLSDFAIYSGDKLPPSFWATYWSSHAAFSDHMVGRDMSDPQKVIAWNLLETIQSGMLQYCNSHGMVEKFLEQEGEAINGTGK